jgi:class 3 adenylate cyclase
MTAVAGRFARLVAPRALIWLFHLALPVAGLALLLARPDVDLLWEDHTAHFWLILGVAGVNLGLAIAVGREGHRRADVRLFLIGLAFVSAAGMFTIHALATLAVVLGTPNASFVLSTPAGILLAGVFGLASAVEPSSTWAARLARARGWLVALMVVVVATWVTLTLVPGSPLALPLPDAQSHPILRVLGFGGVVLELAVALAYFRLYRRRPSVVLISIVTAFVLLAEAQAAVALSRAWHASWWEWHVLLLLAFGYVAYSAHVQYRREGESTSLFRSLSLEDTVRRIQDQYAAALDGLVAAIEDAAASGRTPELGPLAAQLSARFGLTESQADLLAGAAEALAAERREVRRLGLFRHYLWPEVASALLEDPDQAALGGATVEVSVLFADLQGFTAYADHTQADAVVGLLNEYFGDIVPIVLSHGGTVVQFVGDGIVALFNAPIPQPDHALRAVRAAVSFQSATSRRAERDPGLPRFRVGIATGPALVGNVGSKEVRSFTAIGETVNLASRLQTAAPVGGVVVSATTAERLAGAVGLRSLGELSLKGYDHSVPAFEVTIAPHLGGAGR